MGYTPNRTGTNAESERDGEVKTFLGGSYAILFGASQEVKLLKEYDFLGRFMTAMCVCMCVCVSIHPFRNLILNILCGT